MSLPPPQPLTWYTTKDSNSFGHGSSKNTHQVRWTAFTDGFDPATSESIGESPNPDEYVILSILFKNGLDHITKAQLASLHDELLLQNQFYIVGRAVPIVALKLKINGIIQIFYGISDILNAIGNEYKKDPFPNITQCLLLMRRCKFYGISRGKAGQTVRIGDQFKDPDHLIEALDKLLWYIAEKNLVLTDGKTENYCIYNEMLVVLDSDRKYALDINPIFRENAVRYMAFMFAFAGAVYRDKRRQDIFRRNVLIKYKIALAIDDTTTLSKVKTEEQLNGLYNAFGLTGGKMIKHYLARDLANPVKHILNSLIFPLFTTPAPSAPSPPPSSTKKRSHDDDYINYEKKALTDKDNVNDDEADHVDKANPRTDPLTEEVNSADFEYLRELSANLGGRSRKQRKRRPKSKKTRRKRSLLNHNLTR
jgi:hypothetical protein